MLVLQHSYVRKVNRNLQGRDVYKRQGSWKADFYNRAFFFADAHRFLPGPDNQKNRIADYQDREDIYERPRRKMHDYKNQLSTIQTLIKNGHTDEALSFTQKLTCLLYTSRCV